MNELPRILSSLWCLAMESQADMREVMADWDEAFLGYDGHSEDDLIDYIDFLAGVLFGPLEPPGSTGWYSLTWTPKELKP